MKQLVLQQQSSNTHNSPLPPTTTIPHSLYPKKETHFPPQVILFQFCKMNLKCISSAAQCELNPQQGLLSINVLGIVFEMLLENMRNTVQSSLRSWMNFDNLFNYEQSEYYKVALIFMKCSMTVTEWQQLECSYVYIENVLSDLTI